MSGEEVSKDELFFVTFVGEWVEVLIRAQITSPDGITMPYSFEGYFLDYNEEELFFFGSGADQIERVINKKDIILITIVRPKNSIDNILDNFEPEKEGDIN